MNDEREIDIESGWKRVQSRIMEAKTVPSHRFSKSGVPKFPFMRIAAVSLIILTLGAAVVYLGRSGSSVKKMIIATNNDQKNMEVVLPDNSKVILNRNTTLTYRADFGRSQRNVTLSGEAFFDIKSDVSKPFIIDAGNASVQVLGTSFNVITNNNNSAVEVFVKTGTVMLSNNSGSQRLMIEPGYIGVIDSKLSEKTPNDNPNYMAWNTGVLIYDGQKLEVVFSDLKKVYNIDIIADESSISDETWVSPPIDNMPEDTIIRLICGSFNLSFIKDGQVYHLARK
jgi:ferric-dicitrate binding protein FerR (iron transport regulator)